MGKYAAYHQKDVACVATMFLKDKTLASTYEEGDEKYFIYKDDVK